ncbi:sugar-binding domain-containing protein [Quadrisphaera sp. INWT6]|uniref:sugar-binding domain-containing protein n=1 Tax=Quadrisphaera sp. INWT6 TaxID=2596917 RepID=UPI0019D63541|nr:sugar-binding domain-containing protein [Quadrisphaera sp. INWT6]
MGRFQVIVDLLVAWWGECACWSADLQRWKRGVAPWHTPTPWQRRHTPPSDRPADLPRASAQDGTHPRPQLLRPAWTDLGGTWQLGLVRAGGPAGGSGSTAAGGPRWRRTDLADRTGYEHDVVVPYPPESEASGVGDQGPFAELWYRRDLRLRDVAGADRLADGHRLVLRFGAVDHAARVWFDGHLVAEHTGGQTPFSADVTELLDAGSAGDGDQLDAFLDGEHVVVVRAVDDARDPELPAASRTGTTPPTPSGTAARPASGRRCGPRWSPRSASST